MSLTLACMAISTSEINAQNIEMVFVQGGTFTMGCSNSGDGCFSNEEPAHSVTLNSFYIGKYEVTQAQWKAVMGNSPSLLGDNYPVSYVTWYEVQEFIKRLNAKTGKKYRLPTEAEWEYAARGGNKSKGYKYSGSNDIREVAFFRENSRYEGKPSPVGQFKSNELGLYDMSGNVYEWCNDWDNDYSPSPQKNPQGPDFSPAGRKVDRGGAYNCSEDMCRVLSRDSVRPENTDFSMGFRLAMSAQ